jgi:hypothetical protein
MYKKTDAIAIAGKRSPTNGTNILGKNCAAIIYLICRSIKNKTIFLLYYYYTNIINVSKQYNLL